MIYVVSVHWQSHEWIPIQRRFLDRFVRVPFRYVGSLEGIADGWAAYFDETVRTVGCHAGKLNLLAMAISRTASDTDTIYFLDGDAFPVGDIVSVVEERLASSPLVAIRRDENRGDPQPHPSFCATRVGFWREIHGDWSEGYAWNGPDGVSTDVGANLMYQLDVGGWTWSPLLRSNARNLHPLWFGVYGGVVYHHGAGFRQPMSRRDREDFERLTSDWAWVPRPVMRGAYLAWRERRRWSNRNLSSTVRDWIEAEDDFFARFI